MPKGFGFNPQRAPHRGTTLHGSYYSKNLNRDWHINGVPYAAARLGDSNGWWLIPVYANDEPTHEDFGPYKTLAEAGVIALLMDNKP